jgi:transcription antitermination factor NusA-like protein
MDELKQLIDLIVKLGLGAALTLVVVIYLISDPVAIFKIWVFLAKLIHKIFGRWKKSFVASQIETHINSAIQQLGSESPAAFDKAMKLEWISSGEEHAVLKKGSVVVRVRDDPNLARLMVNATLLYLQEGVIPDSRPYIEMRVLKAVDLILAHRFLEHSPAGGTINYLTRNCLEPALAEDERVADYFETADNVDRAGLLSRVVLREFSGLASKLVGRRPTREIRNESVYFFEFVGRFVGRRNEIPLTFFGRYLRCTVALIARPEVYERAGLSLYQRNFQRDIDTGMHIIYLLARGERNIHVGRAVAKWALSKGLISGSIPDRYMQPDETGELVPAECIVCFSSRVGRSVKIGPLEEVQIALAQYVPESLTGGLEIVSIAREPGITTKVLVRSDVDQDPIPICTGANNSRLRLISDALGEDEKIDFIAWNADVKKNIISALVPLDEDDVHNVLVTPDSLSAKVIINNPEAAHRAVGSEGVNLRLAERLLSLRIQVETRQRDISPEEELLGVLRYRIPEIEEGKIEVVKVARRVGRVSKVAVRGDPGLNVRRACIGPDASVVRAISHDLGGEHIAFIVWDSNDVERCLCEALYPLRDRNIIDISIDKEERKAFVTVKAEAVALAIGKDGDNVRLAEDICELQVRISGPTKL